MSNYQEAALEYAEVNLKKSEELIKNSMLLINELLEINEKL